MLILVKKTTRASANENGNIIKEYIAGEVYDIYEDLANVFIAQGWGVEYKEKAIEQAPKQEAIIEEKAIDNLENKAIEQAPENKAITKKKNK